MLHFAAVVAVCSCLLAVLALIVVICLWDQIKHLYRELWVKIVVEVAQAISVAAGLAISVFPADEKVTAYLDGRTDRPWTAERSDPDAEMNVGNIVLRFAGRPAVGDRVAFGDSGTLPDA